jgi:hypothetical protein
MHILILALSLLIASPSMADDAVVDPNTGFVFPETVAGFKYQDRREYGDPRLGYGLDYWSKEGILITVIVYDLGLKDIADGIEDPRVRQQMKLAQEDVERAVSLGAYRAATPIDDSVKRFSPLLLQASYHLVRKDGAERRSYLFMRGQHRHFIKLRATCPTDWQLDTRISHFLEAFLTITGAKQ